MTFDLFLLIYLKLKLTSAIWWYKVVNTGLKKDVGGETEKEGRGRLLLGPPLSLSLSLSLSYATMRNSVTDRSLSLIHSLIYSFGLNRSQCSQSLVC